ncbi:nuclear transport factor 2 family protein [Bordetella sp. BOR01]|nr:nuclear transport factor 2 family protein [Bordetella sp. BOR01]
MQQAPGESAYSGGLACVLKFFYALDVRDHEAAAAMMAPDGIWHRQGVALKGQAAILEALARRPANRRTCHIITNFRILQAGLKHAEAAFYLTAYEGTLAAEAGNGSEGLRLLAIRDCRDSLTLTPGGWRIAEKRSNRHLPPE